jgi:hypothetical protein
MSTYGIPSLEQDWNAFIRLPPDALVSRCLRIFDKAREDPELLDFDHLLSFGIRLRKTSVSTLTMSNAAIEWACRYPYERAIGVAAAFLNGLWTWNDDPNLVTNQDLIRFVDLIRRVHLTEELSSVAQVLKAIIPMLTGNTRDIAEAALRDLA